MENYKQATREKTRFSSKRGSLSTEQLWDLSPDELNDIAVSLDAEYEQSGKKSFLVKKSAKDKTAKFKLEIVLDILNTKLEEAQVAAEALEIKEHNKKILAAIADLDDKSLKSKSRKELEKMMK